MSTESFNKLKDFFGGRQRSIADALGVSEQAVSHWKKRGIPTHLGAEIEALTNNFVTAKEISGGSPKAKRAKACRS